MLLRSFPDFPYQPCFCDVRGTRMAVVDEGSGDGPPLVLLHGNPTWSYLWRKVIPVLAPARRVLAPDLVGHGRSGKPDTGYRLADHIGYFDELMDGLGLDRVVRPRSLTPATKWPPPNRHLLATMPETLPGKPGAQAPCR